MINIDPEFKSWILPLRPDEFTGLEGSLLADGCREPLVMWNDILIDGHNRYEICTKHDIPFKTVNKDFASRDDVKNWIINNQLGRRNVTSEQRDYMLGKLYSERKGNREDNLKQNLPKGNNFPSVTAADSLANQFKVTDRTVRNAEKFSEAVDTLADTCGDEIRDQILTRELPITKKDVVDIARQSPEIQKRVIKSIRYTGASSTAALREATVPEKPTYTKITRLEDLKEPPRPKDPDLTLCSCANPDCDNFVTLTRSQRRKFFTTYYIKYGQIELPYCSKECSDIHQRALRVC
ncbi:MAG: ParB N-terminal domain-containing protein [Methanosarcinaceae archaeon]